MIDCSHMAEHRHLKIVTRRDGELVGIKQAVCDPFHTTTVVLGWSLWDWLKMLFRQGRSTTVVVSVEADCVATGRWFKGVDACETKPHEHVIAEVARERERQMAVEGWTPEHDDIEHPGCQLAVAAACYAAPEHMERAGCTPFGRDSEENTGKHPRRRRLVIAAALLVAEIERVDRLAKCPVTEAL